MLKGPSALAAVQRTRKTLTLYSAKRQRHRQPASYFFIFTFIRYRDACGNPSHFRLLLAPVSPDFSEFIFPFHEKNIADRAKGSPRQKVFDSPKK